MRRARTGTGGVARWWPALILLAAVLPPSGARAAPEQPPPRILDVRPARQGDMLVCNLRTAGLPGPRLASSMESGLVSSVDVLLDLVNAQDEVVAENRMTLRLAFDLWEEVFSVRNHEQRRFAALGEVEDYLAHLSHVPVGPASLLDRGGPFRIRAGLRLHAVAPSERERAGDVIVGDSEPSGATAGGGQEVTISLGRLIRFFYEGRSRREGAELEAESPPFRREEVDDAAD